MILGELDERGVVYLTCTDEYHPVSGVIRLNVRLEIGSWDRLGVFVGSKDGAAKWLAQQKVVETHSRVFLKIVPWKATACKWSSTTSSYSFSTSTCARKMTSRSRSILPYSSFEFCTTYITSTGWGMS